jgi:glycosyltransferase involved in cell wall biosynthesis
VETARGSADRAEHAVKAAVSPAIDTLVDVGIPTFGEPRFLVEAIESVLAQTLTAWQLTISENGPGSAAVAAAVEPFLSDPRVRYVTTGRNLGPAGNWTGLIRTGQGPYVALLNDDDRWEPGFLARRVSFLEEHPSCAFVFSPCDFIDEAGAVVHHFVVDLREGVQRRTTFLRSLYMGNLVSIPTILVRRATYEAVGSEFNASLLFFDYEMWLRLASRFDVGFLAGADARYRVHASQTTQHLRMQMAKQRSDLLDEAESFLPTDVPRLMRRRARYIAFVRMAVDAYVLGERRRSCGTFIRALHAYPLGPLDPKVAVRMIRRMQGHGEFRDFWRVDETESFSRLGATAR